MILIDNDKRHYGIYGESIEVVTELIYVIKELQKDWKEQDREDEFKRIIRDCLDAKELERK